MQLLSSVGVSSLFCVYMWKVVKFNPDYLVGRIPAPRVWPQTSGTQRSMAQQLQGTGVWGLVTVWTGPRPATRKTHIVCIFILLAAFSPDQPERKNRIVAFVLHVYMTVGCVCAGKGSALCLGLVTSHMGMRVHVCVPSSVPIRNAYSVSLLVTAGVGKSPLLGFGYLWQY